MSFLYEVCQPFKRRTSGLYKDVTEHQHSSNTSSNNVCAPSNAVAAEGETCSLKMCSGLYVCTCLSFDDTHGRAAAAIAAAAVLLLLLLL